jgi:hypothetical protein
MRYRLGVSWLISNMIRSPRPGVCRHGQRRCSLPHLVGPATQLWSGFGGVTTESKKWHTIPNFCGLLLAILVYIYICMYVYIYTYGSYIIPILIYIYIHTYQTPPYLGWFMMVSYRVFFWDGSWTVDPRRTFAPSWSLSSCEGPTWGRRGNHVRFVELNQSLFWSTWNSPMKIVLVILVLLFIHGGFDLWISAQGWWMISSYGTPVIKMFLWTWPTFGRRTEGAKCASWRFPGEPPVSDGRPKRAGTSKGRLPAIRKLETRHTQ